VVAAAGSGERLGAGGPKALVELGGRPLLAWSLDALRETAISAVVIAAPPGSEDEVAALAGSGVQVVTGGATRAESVARALSEVATELVAIHDAARPLAGAGLFDAVLVRLLERPDADGVIAATPLTDTVKRAREPRDTRGEVERGGPTIAKTESRDHLWAAQTPQAFRTEKLREAYAADRQRVAAATDEAMLIEKAGGKVLIEPSTTSNLKVTTPEDLRIAELLLKQR
jgi:2-C-methyl-D-erythritol 4-phosphate cytidylyltransferase